jgi:hypothetical protein
MRPIAHPDFGRELRRDFEVCDECYDCVEFYAGCGGWRASMAFACRNVNPLPDVQAGTTGQPWPGSKLAKKTWNSLTADFGVTDCNSLPSNAPAVRLTTGSGCWPPTPPGLPGGQQARRCAGEDRKESR